MRAGQFRWIWPAVLVTACVCTTTAADRVVLCEEFTATTCYYCQFAGPALGRMLNTFPNTFTMLQIHTGDSYATTWGNLRDTFYNVTGTPTAWFDGVTSVVGASSESAAYTAYLNKYNARRAVATDVNIYVTAEQQSGGTFLVRARVCVESGGVQKTMRVHIAQVLDYYPTNPSYSRNCFIQAATSEDVTVAPGECAVVTRTMTFSGPSWSQPNSMRLIVFAQQPTTSGPATVYNASITPYPFPTDCNDNGAPDNVDIALGWSADCNTNGAPDECDILFGTSLDENGNGIPDECEAPTYELGDLNCNEVVGFDDINTFVLALSNAEAYGQQYPDCDIMNGDINQNGTFGFDDINPFVALLSGGL